MASFLTWCRIALFQAISIPMSRVTIYSTADCTYCSSAKAMLKKWGIAFDEVRIDQDAEAMQQFRQATNGARTVPQIIIDGNLVGGFSELTELHMDGELDSLMANGQ